MSIELILATAGTALYVAASALAVIALVGPAERRERGALGLMLAGALALLVVLGGRISQAGCIPTFSRFDALACYALALSAAYGITMLLRFTRGVSAILLPFASAALLWGLPALRVEPGPPPPVQTAWLPMHVAAAFGAYAVFSLASFYATVYLVQDHNLRHKKFGVVWERLPSLETLDQLMTRLVGIAFLLFSVAIIAGFVLIRRSGGGQEWIADPKVGATAVTWILLAVLVHMRANADRHGRGVALLTAVGLACVFFLFFGVHMLGNSLHAFLHLGGGKGVP